MINEYDRPAKGYKTSEQYDHPATVLYDNFAPEENVYVETAIEETPSEDIVIEEVVEPAVEELTEEIVEEKEGE